MRVLRQQQGGQAEDVVSGGRYPGVSADESTLVFVRNDGQGDALWRQVRGGGSDCALVPAGAFVFLGPPRISPDGSTVAFGASGEPTLAASSCAGDSGRTPAVARWFLEWSIPGDRVAYAHGRPWAIWSVNVNGGGLKRLSDLTGDDLSVAWSADGHRLAVLTPTTLNVVTVATGAVEKLADVGGEGTLDWR